MPTVEYERPNGETEQISGNYADTDGRGEFVIVLAEPEDGVRERTRIPLCRVIRIDDGVVNDD